MSDAQDEVSLAELLEEIDDPQIREVISKSSNARLATYKAMEYILDSVAMSSARRLMTSPDVPDTIKRDMILGWLNHRRSSRELEHRMTGNGNQGGAISFTFNMNQQEGNNVQRARAAFGVAEVEDAVISD